MNKFLLSLSKEMKMMLLGLSILFGLIFGYHLFQKIMLKHQLAKRADMVMSVSSTKATKQPWQPFISATGSLRATLGVNVTTELAGMVREIYFKPGDKIEKGMLLIKLNDDTEVAQLHAYQAEAALAEITYERDKAQYEIKAVSQATLDADLANWKNQIALVQQQTATIAKKNIRAPFSGKLGINLVYPGQYLSPGDSIVTLQQLDPIFVDFFLPQQELVNIKTGQNIKLTTDVYPGKEFLGQITTIDPQVDTATRNVKVEATISNSDELLYPGMFGQVIIDTGKIDQFVTVPQNAISFNSYGNIIYVVKDNKAHQVFVQTGDTRDNQIAVLSGIEDGDEVITSGQLKLKNGSPIKISNDLFKNESALEGKTKKLDNAIDQSEDRE